MQTAAFALNRAGGPGGLSRKSAPARFFRYSKTGAELIFSIRKTCACLKKSAHWRDIGIDSFKIEGRMKGPLYLASVTRAYRQAIDRCAEGRTAYRVEPNWIEDLQRVSHRPYTKGHLFENAQGARIQLSKRGFHMSRPIPWQASFAPARIAIQLSAEWRAEGKIFLEARSRLVPGQRLEFMYPDGSSASHLLDLFEDINGNRLAQAHPNRWIRFCVDFPVFPFQTVRLEKNRKAPKGSFLNYAGH